MAKDINVLLVEDDFYARHWMEMLLRRDWRTRVVGEVSNPVDLSKTLDDLQDHQKRLDVALIDTDIPNDHTWLQAVVDSLSKRSPTTTVLLTGMAPNLRLIRDLGEIQVSGYILKDEIRYSLAWAVMMAAEQHWVVTPGVYEALLASSARPRRGVCLDGRNSIAKLTKRDAEAARLAFMFSMERRDLADELQISEDYSYGVVSALYEKIGLNDVLLGDEPIEAYFGNQPILRHHIEAAITRLRCLGDTNGGSRKIKEKETLAFHLLTFPDFVEIT